MTFYRTSVYFIINELPFQPKNMLNFSSFNNQTFSFDSRLVFSIPLKIKDKFCGVEQDVDVGDERLEYGILLLSTPTSSAILIRYWLQRCVRTVSIDWKGDMTKRRVFPEYWTVVMETPRKIIRSLNYF